jgi:hypothetical protein
MKRKLIFKKIIFISTFLLLNINFLKAQVYHGTKLVPGHTFIVKENIDWEAYDSTSTVTADNIEIKDLQGLWKAYNGLFKVQDIVRRIEISKPFIFEVKDNKVRRESYGGFIPFSLKNNSIVMFEDHKIVTGIINKISPNELIITWKNESEDVSYTRYFYSKK